MIRELLLTAALLLPGLAYGQNPSASFSDQVVPAGSDPIACDFGPNAPSLPAPANEAGFTHCLMNADFTSSTTDGNGINYSNTATYVKECGASPTSRNNTIWDLSWFNANTYGYNYNLPCTGHLEIVTDPITSTQALEMSYLTTDYNNFTSAGGANHDNYTAVHWPQPYAPSGCAAGPSCKGLYHTYYIQVAMRLAASVGSYPGGNIMNSFWDEQCCFGEPDQEVDYFEIQPAYDSQYCASGGVAVHTNFSPSGGSSPAFWCIPVDNNYHTIGVLMTSDGTTTLATCVYLDGNIATHTPTTCGTQPISSLNYGNSLTFWIGMCALDQAGSPCITQNFFWYLSDVQVWTCSTPWAACTGTVITSQNEPTTRFAWLRRAIGRRENLLVMPAKADEPSQRHAP
jgi:hypothetical protein